jgi:hypothetical protein
VFSEHLDQVVLSVCVVKLAVQTIQQAASSGSVSEDVSSVHVRQVAGNKQVSPRRNKGDLTAEFGLKDVAGFARFGFEKGRHNNATGVKSGGNAPTGLKAD